MADTIPSGKPYDLDQTFKVDERLAVDSGLPTTDVSIKEALRIAMQSPWGRQQAGTKKVDLLDTYEKIAGVAPHYLRQPAVDLIKEAIGVLGLDPWEHREAIELINPIKE
jgi:hypothetical protein